MKRYVQKRMERGRLPRGKVRVYARRTQAPHRQGQKLGENEKDKYVPPEVNTSKRLGSIANNDARLILREKVNGATT